MADQFIGEIRMFAISFPPKGWALCNGDSLSVKEHQALYSVLGNTYGGDNKNFNLPDLRGRTPLGVGKYGERGPTYKSGERGGAKTVTLPLSSLPKHRHGLQAHSTLGANTTPKDCFLGNATETAGQPGIKTFVAAKTASLVALHKDSVGDAGLGQPFDIRQPYMAMTYCIALTGDYPPKRDD